MSQAPRGSKLARFINSRVKVVVLDKRYFVGQMLAFDTHSNIVLRDCEEYRPHKKRKGGQVIESKRTIGLMILRGETVSHIDIVGPPPPNGNRLSASTASYVLIPGSKITKAKQSTAGIGKVEIPIEDDSISKPAVGVGMPSVPLDTSAKPILPASNLPQ